MKQCKKTEYKEDCTRQYSCIKCGRMSDDAKEICRLSKTRFQKEKKKTRKLRERKQKLLKKLAKVQEELDKLIED